MALTACVSVNAHTEEAKMRHIQVDTVKIAVLSISFSIEVGDVKTEDERLGIALVIADAIQKLRDKHKVEVIPVLKNKA